MATTITAIRTALEALIVGTTPAGDAFGISAYKVAGTAYSWDARPDSDIDREFTIDNIPPGEAGWIGGETETILETSLDVIVGHVQVGESDRDKSRGRRDRDLEQITRALENPDNYPAGVCAIVRAGAPGYESAREDKYWITTLSFELTYLGAV